MHRAAKCEGCHVRTAGKEESVAVGAVMVVAELLAAAQPLGRGGSEGAVGLSHRYDVVRRAERHQGVVVEWDGERNVLEQCHFRTDFDRWDVYDDLEPPWSRRPVRGRQLKELSPFGGDDAVALLCCSGGGLLEDQVDCAFIEEGVADLVVVQAREHTVQDVGGPLALVHLALQIGDFVAEVLPVVEALEEGHAILDCLRVASAGIVAFPHPLCLAVHPVVPLVVGEPGGRAFAVRILGGGWRWRGCGHDGL
jgi:hypothetical protein